MHRALESGRPPALWLSFPFLSELGCFTGQREPFGQRHSLSLPQLSASCANTRPPARPPHSKASRFPVSDSFLVLRALHYRYRLRSSQSGRFPTLLIKGLGLNDPKSWED